MDRDEIIALLKEVVELDVESDDRYTGDMDGSGRLYTRSTTVTLKIDGEVISSISV